VEAIANALRNLATPTVGVSVISSGVGGITESDVTLAKASSAIVIGFNVRPAGKSRALADQEGVDIKMYQIIYDAIDDVKKAMVGMLSPVTREKIIGKAEIRQVFHIAKAGTVAGCTVVDGKLTRKAQIRWCAIPSWSSRGSWPRCDDLRKTPARLPMGTSAASPLRATVT